MIDAILRALPRQTKKCALNGKKGGAGAVMRSIFLNY
jgi:hypothetical protein